MSTYARDSSAIQRGQAIFEYALLLAIVMAALAGIQVYARRGIQAGVKLTVDGMSPYATDVDGKRAQADGIVQEAGRYYDEDEGLSLFDQSRHRGVLLNKRSAGNVVTNQNVKVAVGENGNGTFDLDLSETNTGSGTLPDAPPGTTYESVTLTSVEDGKQ